MRIREFEERVVKVTVGDGCATAFIYDVEGQDFYITAKHVVKSIGNKGKIGIMRTTTVEEYDATVYYHSDDTIDIAVFTINRSRENLYGQVQYRTSPIGILQEVIFFGYPFTINSFTISDIEQDVLAIPLVKKAYISGIHATEKSTLLLMDGHSNQGFSGAPICYIDKFDDNKPAVICGVLGGYLNYTGDIYYRDEPEKIEEKYIYKENAGIVYAYGIDHALEIIKSI